MPAMFPRTEDSPSVTRSLVVLYLNVGAWYLVVVAGLWALGVESLYGHPTPFYALISPSYSLAAVPATAGILMLLGTYVWASRGPMARDSRLYLSLSMGLLVGVAGFSLLYDAGETGLTTTLAQFWTEFRWHALVLSVFTTGFVALAWAWPRLDEDPGRRETTALLVSLLVFTIVFALATAMIRDGANGITQTYERYTYEYISDIGKTRSIALLFEKYNDMQDLLSMHAKVHPPGPIVILWLISYLTGQDPLGLSLGTVIFGSLSIVPLYGLARDVAGGRAALVTAALFSVVPGFTLFNAVSTDVTFLPFTLATLWWFWRAVDRGSAKYAAAAGFGYACMTLISFSLVGIGAFFGFVGLWKLADSQRRKYVLMTALIMVAVLLAVHGAVRLGTGYDVIENFQNAKMQFDDDQRELDTLSPRYPGWTFRIWNPMCWFFFAGIPISVLFIKMLMDRKRDCLTPPFLIVTLLTLVTLNLLYLGRGEGERSAMYLYPFVAIPAGAYLTRLCVERRSYAPFLATLMLVAAQSWAIETFFYTYW